mgnify:FL=1
MDEDKKKGAFSPFYDKVSFSSQAILPGQAVHLHGPRDGMKQGGKG